MQEPSRRTSRRLLAAGAAAALALAGAGFALGRASVEPPPAPAPSPSPSPSPPAPTPTPPALPGPLGRADLLAVAAAAADAFAAGRPFQPDPALIGRRFELRLPFGCRGLAIDGSADPLRWSYDAEEKALRLRAEPVALPLERWTAPVPEDEEPAVEAIEAFWVERPWSTSEACPPPAPAGAPAPPAASTLGVAQFFTLEGSRVLRRDGEAFEAVVKVEPDALNASQRFRLVLRGRVARTPDGPPLACRASSPDLRPTCLLAAEVDAVAIENAATGEALADWTG